MKLTISTIKSVASRNVWSSDWVAPFCDSIMFYKKGVYSHTHPEWRENETAILKELDFSINHLPVDDGTYALYSKYSTPIRIVLIKVNDRGWYQAMKRKAALVGIEGENIILGSDRDALASMGDIDKVKTVPSWQNDFWNQKKIWNSRLRQEDVKILGNLQTTTLYPTTGNMVLEVLYAED